MAKNMALIVLALLLVAGGSLWMGGLPPGSYNSTAHLVGVSFASAETALSPSVITTASKLGQGRAAVQGSAVVVDYELPTLRSAGGGLALLIPGSALPGVVKHEQLARLAGGSRAELVFDVYSWSLGTLVATTPFAVAVGASHPQVPEQLMALARGASHSHRLMLVLPPKASGMPAELDVNDAYIVVAEVTISE